jgi:hypothetical protein
MYLELPQTVMTFKQANDALAAETNKKKFRKLINLINDAKRAIPPADMAEAVSQIKDNLLKAKVAGIIAWDLGDKGIPGIYEALKPMIHKYPRGGIIEPEISEVVEALVALGYAPKDAKKMATPPKEGK